MTISIKNTVFLDVTSCSLINPRMLYDPFPFPLLLYNLSVARLVFFQLCGWKQYIPFRSWYLFTKLHGIMSQKTVILNLNVVTCDYLYYEWKQLNASLEKQCSGDVLLYQKPRSISEK